MNTPAPRNDTAVVVRLSEELRDAVKACADQEDRSVASLLRRAAREYIDRSEQPR